MVCAFLSFSLFCLRPPGFSYHDLRFPVISALWSAPAWVFLSWSALSSHFCSFVCARLGFPIMICAFLSFLRFGLRPPGFSYHDLRFTLISALWSAPAWVFLSCPALSSHFCSLVCARLGFPIMICAFLSFLRFGLRPPGFSYHGLRFTLISALWFAPAWVFLSCPALSYDFCALVCTIIAPEL